MKIRYAAAALALGLAACGTSGSDGAAEEAHGDHAEHAGHDTSARDAAVTWLGSQLADNGLMHNTAYQSDDPSTTADAGISLLALEGAEDAEPVVEHITEGLEAGAAAYVAPGFGTTLSAGSVAKLAVFAQEAGADPTAFGDQDLVELLSTATLDSGPAAGRIQDQLDPKDTKAADWSNTIGQAYAVTALTEAGSDEAGAATDFLLAQQCEEGWFRVTFAADPSAPQQSCDDDPKAAADLDATAFALRALVGLDGDEAADAADRAAAWLLEQQGDDGSFLGGSPAPVANANSTGLAGWALAEWGGDGGADAAEAAAGWVAAHQLGTGVCAPEEAAGAIAYDDTAATSATKGVTPQTEYQFRLATAQALPVLDHLTTEAADAAAADC